MSAHEPLRDLLSSASTNRPNRGSRKQSPEGLHEIRIGKTAIAREAAGPGVLAEIFTMTVGPETIELRPYKNWIQLDSFKWRTRGILPRTPPGLEITWEHLKFADQTISPWDSDACARLENALNQWLLRERRALEDAQGNARSATQAPPSPPDDEVVHFKVDFSNAQQPRVHCLEGDQAVKVVALNQQGLNALIEQGLMRKPQMIKVGALHNWIELDGRVFHFKENPQEAQELERTLNEKYVVAGEPGSGGDVAIFPNPASPTGFDIQFPATPSGIVENRKRHLNEETVQLLQDPERCRVLRKGITAKLAAPDLIFKLKTPEGGECNLEPGPDSAVVFDDGAGQTRTIELSQPVSLLRLGVPELTAVFNHPAINRRARLAAKSIT